MNKKYKDLDEKECDRFAEAFYSEWGNSEKVGYFDDDMVADNPNPWGCPWCYIEDKELLNSDIEKSATLYFKEVEDEIYENVKSEGEKR